MSEAEFICQGIILDESFSDSVVFRTSSESGSNGEASFVRLGNLQPVLNELKSRAEAYLIERDGELGDFSAYRILVGITTAELSAMEQEYLLALHEDGTQTKVPIECDCPVLRATVRVTRALGPTAGSPDA